MASNIIAKESTSPTLKRKQTNNEEKADSNEKSINNYSVESQSNPNESNNGQQHHHHHKHGEAHKLFEPRPSMLSSEFSGNLGHGSYRGFVNLMIILLGITNFRLVVLNLLKYGVLLNFAPLFSIEWQRWPSVIIVAVLNVFVLIGYIIELLATRDFISEHNIKVAQIMNIMALVGVPTSMVWTMRPAPASGIVVMILVTCVAAKMISYAHINHSLRTAARTTDKESEWPHNLTFSKLYYFMAAPTLVYQAVYPRTPVLRKAWLARRIAEAIFFSFLIVAIVEQYIIPLVHNSLVQFENNDVVRILERAMKLSIPNVYVWLLGFYVFFHLYLNITAELLRFADRQFYKDWWNATTLQYFWKNWNMPVYQWMQTTIYGPLIRSGYSSTVASFCCFFVSAIFHELIIAVPFQMVKWWTFIGMVSQLPLIKLSSALKGNQLGNVIFWFSIVLGQPFIVLLMYRDWYQRNYGPTIVSEM